MVFLSILFCLSLEKFFVVEGFLNRAASFHYYLKQLNRLIPLKWQQESYGLLLFLLPILSIALILLTISDAFDSKIPRFLLETILLLYCLGPNDIYHQQKAVPQQLFERAYINLFVVLFWFVWLGPLGALLFRLIERIQCHVQQGGVTNMPEPITVISQTFLGYLSWLPIRFFTGIQAVFGKFPDTLRYWLDHLLMGWSNNEQFVAQIGRIALGLPIETLLNTDQYHEALSIFNKMLLIFLGMVLVYLLLSCMI